MWLVTYAASRSEKSEIDPGNSSEKVSLTDRTDFRPSGVEAETGRSLWLAGQLLGLFNIPHARERPCLKTKRDNTRGMTAEVIFYPPQGHAHVYLHIHEYAYK